MDEDSTAVAAPLERRVRPLVERMRDAAHAWENSLTVCGDHMPSHQMLREAADEIVRLRQVLESLDRFSVKTIRTNSEDLDDWRDDMAFVGKLARGH